MGIRVNTPFENINTYPCLFLHHRNSLLQRTRLTAPQHNENCHKPHSSSKPIYHLLFPKKKVPTKFNIFSFMLQKSTVSVFNKEHNRRWPAVSKFVVSDIGFTLSQQELIPYTDTRLSLYKLTSCNCYQLDLAPFYLTSSCKL